MVMSSTSIACHFQCVIHFHLLTWPPFDHLSNASHFLSMFLFVDSFFYFSISFLAFFLLLFSPPSLSFSLHIFLGLFAHWTIWLECKNVVFYGLKMRWNGMIQTSGDTRAIEWKFRFPNLCVQKQDFHGP